MCVRSSASFSLPAQAVVAAAAAAALSTSPLLSSHLPSALTHALWRQLHAAACKKLTDGGKEGGRERGREGGRKEEETPPRCHVWRGKKFIPSWLHTLISLSLFHSEGERERGKVCLSMVHQDNMTLYALELQAPPSQLYFYPTCIFMPGRHINIAFV